MLNLIKDTCCVQHCRTQIKKCKLKYQRGYGECIKACGKQEAYSELFKKAETAFSILSCIFSLSVL